MQQKYWPYVGAIVLCVSLLAACSSNNPGGDTSRVETSAPESPFATAPLPDNGYKAKITLSDPPAMMRVGEKQSIQVKVQNASDALWKVRGGGDDNKFYIAVGNLWRKAAGDELLTRMDGRYGLPNNLRPGEEVEVPLLITAPKEPGEYILEVDLVQEQVTFFNEKGSPTARTKVTVK
ncbi:MAG: hypothetical protein ACR2HX_17455 [Pyrinomonadaceae bacterium]